MKDVKLSTRSNCKLKWTESNKIRYSKRRYSVALVNAPVDVQANTSGNHSVFPSLGIITLATQIIKYYSNEMDVEVIDGGLYSIESVLSMLRSLKPDFVGISVLTPTYHSGLQIAKCAKEFGAVTILGGEHACFFPKLILAKRNYVDYVVQADGGELALVYILGRFLKKIPQEIEIKDGGQQRIFSRKDGEVIELAALPKMDMKHLYQGEFDVPMLSLVKNNLDITTDNYNRLYGWLHESERKPAVVNNLRGCNHGRKRCIYCSIWDLSINEGDARFFWRTVQNYMHNYGINFFFEVCDNFFSSYRYVRELIRTCPFNPSDEDIEFEIYARASDIVAFQDSVSVLKSLNVTRVNLGLDSGDDNMLKYLRKGSVRDSKIINSLVKVNHEAVNMLAKNGITIHASFPLGALGETPQSLKNTLDFIEYIASRFPGRIATLEASEMIPLPNSPAWELLVSSEGTVKDDADEASTIERLAKRAGISLPDDKRWQLREKYWNEDLLDVRELGKDWIENFTHVSWSDIEEAKETVQNTSKKVGCRFGRAI